MIIKRFFFLNSCLLVMSVAVSGALSPAHAQTASQITQQTYAPPVMRAVSGGGVELQTGGGPDTPQGAEGLHVQPSGLEVAGGLPELAAETATIEASLKGRRVTGADLFSAARDLEAAYARAGFLLARVSLPPQTIRNGNPLKLVVTQGYVSAIDVSALPAVVRARVEAILSPLTGRKNLVRTELERRLLLAGDIPGLMLRSTLKAGDTPGASIIVVDGRHDAVTASFSADNSLSRDLGSYTVTSGADLNNLLGLGEAVYIRTGGYPGFTDRGFFSDDPRNRQIVAGFTLPLGTDGWWLGIEGLDSRTHPDSNSGYSMRDRYQRFSAKLGYSDIRSRDLNAAWQIGFDATDETQDIVMAGAASAFTRDRMRVLRLTRTADVWLPSGGQLSGGLTASFGLDAFGARHATAALPLSRDGAEPDFSKLELSMRYNQPLFDGGLQFSLAARAQTSFGNALVSSEQIGLGGLDWISAYTGGGVQGDTGAVARAELALPVTLPVPDMFPSYGGAAMPYIFGAAGVARLERPTVVEDAVTRAGAFGAGIRFGLSEKAGPHSASLVVEYAHGAATGSGKADRFNARLALRF